MRDADTKALIGTSDLWLRHSCGRARNFAHEWSNSRRTVTRFGDEKGAGTNRGTGCGALPEMSTRNGVTHADPSKASLADDHRRSRSLSLLIDTRFINTHGPRRAGARRRNLPCG